MTLTRRELMIFGGAVLAASGFDLAAAAPSTVTTDVIAGAIRWDAWYDRTGSSLYAQNALGPKKYQKRAPFHCNVVTQNQINCLGTQRGMDAEIQAASSGGLKYWAFGWYDRTSSLRVAWNLYQASDHRDLINWCGLLPLHLLGSTPFSGGKWRSAGEEWVGYMKQRNYQKVQIGQSTRPLLYVNWEPDLLGSYFGGSVANVRIALDTLRQNAHAAGIGDPYIVILSGRNNADILRQVNADATSTYVAAHKDESSGSYRDLDIQTRAYWVELMRLGVPMVPIAMIGWDTRARQESPGPWIKGALPNPKPTQYYELATPKEWAAHMRAAADFVVSNRNSCPSRAILIYSWDECDEGGALIPTLGDPEGAYLRAMAQILR